MRISGIVARATLSFLLAVSVAMPPASAIEVPKARITTSRSGPPFSISTFTYSLMGGGIHMNICNQPSCGQGYKVSYILFKPRPELTFEKYKADRATIARQFKQLAPSGLKFTFKPPTQKKDKLFTFYEAHRISVAPDGRRELTISRTILAKKLSIDLISSGTDPKQVSENLAAFTLAALLFTADIDGQVKR